MFIAWIIRIRCFHKCPLVYFGRLFLSAFKWETRPSSSYNKNQDERRQDVMKVSMMQQWHMPDRSLYPSLPKTVISSSIFNSSKRPRYRCHLLSFFISLSLWKCNLGYANWNPVDFYIWKNKFTLIVNWNNKNAFLLSARLVLANLSPYCI